jgi:hypothetical protein
MLASSGRADFVESFGDDGLYGVLADRGDESVALSIALQHVDSFVKIELAGLPEQGAGLGARFEDKDGIDAKRGLADGRGHALPLSF